MCADELQTLVHASLVGGCSFWKEIIFDYEMTSQSKSVLSSLISPKQTLEYNCTGQLEEMLVLAFGTNFWYKSKILVGIKNSGMNQKTFSDFLRNQLFYSSRFQTF